NDPAILDGDSPAPRPGFGPLIAPLVFPAQAAGRGIERDREPWCREVKDTAVDDRHGLEASNVTDLIKTFHTQAAGIGCSDLTQRAVLGTGVIVFRSEPIVRVGSPIELGLGWPARRRHPWRRRRVGIARACSEGGLGAGCRFDPDGPKGARR